MATSSLRRQVKNIVHNYTQAEVKVREATSNDPWGPPASLMSEIALLTHHAEAFPEIMMMVWRRLNDNGKNWRHVYKAMTLLDYLLKNGSKKVVDECNENIITIQTLKDFQFIDRDGKDQGINVRERAKQIVSLLKDGEKLKQERIQAKNTRRRISNGSNITSNGQKISFNTAATGASCSKLSVELEQVRPQSSGEEELQLQLALAMSREEAEKKASPSAPNEDEELQLQAALSQSKEEYEKERRSAQGEISLIEKALSQYHSSGEYQEFYATKKSDKSEAHDLDFVDVFGPAPTSSVDMWNSGSLLVPNNGPTKSASYGSLYPSWDSLSAANSSSLPWDMPTHSTQLQEGQTSQSIVFGSDKHAGWKEPSVVIKNTPNDPWGSVDTALDIFGQPPLSAALNSQTKAPLKSESPFELELFGESVPSTKSNNNHLELKSLEDSLDEVKSHSRCRTPESFLDPAARSLVNLESLIAPPGSAARTKNPFASGESL
ncbi:hypothetical protein GDO86_013954 [Hymenochirus boettgeri]|uniref:ENTH domain-containing protein n=1 Tax=Hymenochirus boettgeri TaxID=247094 RepID=A0A8T2JS59_9PIPI|nr:hypothetical protein GDO86_013954 [Hymenochirus boettgeri]